MKARMLYEDYLRTDEHRTLRAICLERDGDRCAMCHRQATQVHHRHYKNVKFDFSGTKLEDLTSLCAGCHHWFHFPPSVVDAAERFASDLRETRTGLNCPVCRRHAQIYMRPMNRAMSTGLVHLYRYFKDHPDEQFVHLETLLKSVPDLPSSIRGDMVKHVHFGTLIPRTPKKKPTSRTSDGFYGITELGCRFVEGLAQVPSYVCLYNNVLEETSTTMITISEALDTPIDEKWVA